MRAKDSSGSQKSHQSVTPPSKIPTAVAPNTARSLASSSDFPERPEIRPLAQSLCLELVQPKAIQQQPYYNRIFMEFQRTATAMMASQGEVDFAFESLQRVGEVTPTTIAGVLRQLPQWYDALRKATVDELVEVVIEKGKAMNAQIASGSDRFAGLNMEERQGDITTIQEYHSAWVPVASALGYKVPRFVELANELKDLVEQRKALSRQVVLKEMLQAYQEGDDDEKTKYEFVQAMSAPGVEGTTLTPECARLMDSCYVKAMEELAVWAQSDKGLEVQATCNKLLTVASTMKSMLGTRGSHLLRNLLEDIINPNTQLKTKFLELPDPAKYVAQTKHEQIIQHVLHLQALLARSKGFSAEIAKYKGPESDKKILERVVKVLETLHINAERQLMAIAEALRKTALTESEKHLEQSRKLVGEKPDTKVWAHKLDKDVSKLTFEDVAKAAENTLMKESCVGSIKTTIGLLQQDCSCTRNEA